MKIFLSFRYTGYSRENLKELFLPIIEAFRKNGHECYCFLEDEHQFEKSGMSIRDMFSRVFSQLKSSDTVAVVVRSNDRSEGMLMEVGYAMALGKSVILFKQVDSSTYIEEVCAKSFTFERERDVLGLMESVLCK